MNKVYERLKNSIRLSVESVAGDINVDDIKDIYEAVQSDKADFIIPQLEQNEFHGKFTVTVNGVLYRVRWHV